MKHSITQKVTFTVTEREDGFVFTGGPLPNPFFVPKDGTVTTEEDAIASYESYL